MQRNVNNIVRHTPSLFPKELWNVCQASVNDETRTNNQCEGWNTRFLHLVGQHPSIWKIIKSIKLERMVATSMAQHEVGNLMQRNEAAIMWNYKHGYVIFVLHMKMEKETSTTFYGL